MKWPPYLLKLRIKNHRHHFGLWLPLFLLWPIVLVFLLAVFLVLLPFALLAVIFTWQVGWWRPVFVGIPAVFRLLWSLRGLTVDVEGADGRVELVFH